MSTPYWEVAIQGHPPNLAYLARHFTAPPVVVVKHDDADGYALRLDEFENCRDSESVLAAAERQLVLLSGVLKLHRHSVDSLTAGPVFRKQRGGGQDVFVFVRDTLRLRMDIGDPVVTVIDAEGRPVPQAVAEPRSVRVMRLCAADAAVEKAMRLVAAADAQSWVGLYRRYEVIESDVGGQRALESRAWSAAGDVGRFKHCPNSVTVAGDGARHGKEPTAPPAKPMMLEEADALVRQLMDAWLASKGI